jgi:hypothetical protein
LAAAADSTESISLNPNPFDWPLALSIIKFHDFTAPITANKQRISSLVASCDGLPTKSLADIVGFLLGNQLL